MLYSNNAPCHTSRASMCLFEKNGIKVMKWSPQSPDRNPIENLRFEIAKRMKIHKTNSKKELEAKLYDEGLKIENQTAKLVANMKNRIKAVIKAKGGFTKY